MNRNESFQGGSREDEEATTTVRVPCPGAAHRTGGTCLVCDPGSSGTIDVFVTAPERAALRRVAQGLPCDRDLALRLRHLGLMLEISGALALTPLAHEMLGANAYLVN